MSSQFPWLFNILDVGAQLLLVVAAILAYAVGHKLRFWQVAAFVFPWTVGSAFVAHVFAIRLGLLASTVMTSCWVFLGLVAIRPNGVSTRLASVFAVFSTVVYFRYSGSVAPWSVGFLLFLALSITVAVCTLAAIPENRRFLTLYVAFGLLPLVALAYLLSERGMDFDFEFIAKERRTY